MIRNAFLLLISFSFLNAQKRPKLVVGIVVDQMKYEYLYQFYNDYSNDGFKRLMNKGFNFRNTQYNYLPTYTAPGHSSIYTGATPSVHGIVGNSWYHKQEQKSVYCTADDRYRAIGDESEERAGKQSPWRLQSSTITDELKIATEMKAKVIGISIKDRGAILPAGHFANYAFWMNENGNFVSSTFYADSLPHWVKEYNQKKQAQKYLKQGWNFYLEKDNYTESIEDDNHYEMVFKSKKAPTFPYDLDAISKEEGIDIIKSTPYGNNMVAELALEALYNEQLGQRNTTDFLAISFSSTDYVGHAFGPRSKEIQDTYIRLDRTLATLIKAFDKSVGKGNYLLFLTADHAVADIPLYLKDHRYKVKSLNLKNIKTEITEHLNTKLGVDVVEEYKNQNLFLNEQIIAELELDYEEIIEEAQRYFMQKEFVKRAYSREEILEGNLNDYHLSMIARGFDPAQNGDVFVQFKPGYFEGYGDTGTTHGTSYTYDTHVPNLWYGWQVPKGESVNRKIITQIAPTIAMFLNIGFPNGSMDNVLVELFE